MKILAFDCSGKTISAAVSIDDTMQAEIFSAENRNHAPYLLPAIEEVLSRVDLQPKDLDLIAVTTGPGSFTGLRIGIATAKGLGDTLGIPLAGVNTIDTLALQQAAFPGLIVPLLDARKGQVYTAVYDNRAGKREQLLAYSALSPVEELKEILSPYQQIVFLGDAADIWRSQLQEVYGSRAMIASGEDNGIHARHIIPLAKEKEAAATVEPFYLRGVDAKAKFSSAQQNRL